MEDLECGICMENFSEEGSFVPKLLDCDHSICRKCLEKMAKDDNILVCPFCREATFQPSSIPNDETKLNVMKMIEQSKLDERRLRLSHRASNRHVPTSVVPADLQSEDAKAREELDVSRFQSWPTYTQDIYTDEKDFYSRASAPPLSLPYQAPEASNDSIIDNFREEDERARRQLASSSQGKNLWVSETTVQEVNEEEPLISRQPEPRVRPHPTRRCSCTRYCVICSTILIVVLSAVFIFGIIEIIKK